MKIPIQMRPIYDELAEVISEYCGQFLSEDYRALCLRLLGKLCCKRPSPLLRGRRNTWAAGIVYAIAANNFIFDKSMPIHRTAGELSRPFGLAPSTASAKAAEIRKLVRLSPLDAQWLLPELIEENPALWTFSLNGFIVDARDLPLEIQQEAAKRGLVPHVPPLKGLDAPKENSNTPDPLQRNLPPRNSRAANASHPSANAEPPAYPDDFSDIYDRFRTV